MKRATWIICALLIAAQASWAEPDLPVLHDNVLTENRAFSVGEKLTFSVSWSSIIEAGTAVLEVKKGNDVEGRPTYELLSKTRSVGVLDLFYPVRDTVESVIDACGLYSLSFRLQESHGKKKRQRTMDYDRDKGIVRVTVNNGTPTIYSVPDRIQDALSSLYYVRTRDDFVTGKSIVVDVHDGDKTYAVEVEVMGKEHIKTPAGEFDTIKVKTYPKYEGVFMNKGEIFMWLTDDARKIPVLMKSEISIGSIVATLVNIQGRKDGP
jgi:hypothetical protein